MALNKQKLKQRLIRIGRDLIVLLVVLQVAELWQSRGMISGNLPFKLQDLTALDADHTLTWQSDQYQLIYAFAPWCGVCRMSAANLNRLKSLNIHAAAIALNYDDVQDVKDFVTNTGLKIPVLLADQNTETALAVHAFPSYFLLSPEGEIVKSWSGYTTTAGLLGKVLLTRLIR